MKKLLFFCGVAAVLCSSCGKRIARVRSVDIVPQPVSVVASDRAFDLTKNTKICLLSDDSTLNYSVRLFNGLLDKSFGKPLPVIKSTQPGGRDQRAIGRPAARGIYAEYPSGRRRHYRRKPAGVFYARFQTLRQLLPVAVARGRKSRRHRIARRGDRRQNPLRPPRRNAGRVSSLLYRRRRESFHRHPRYAQTQSFPLAPDRRPGVGGSKSNNTPN